ncbi:hypothetical protein DVH05_003962 [Phytophthora capsici]|nr:hypothetical protein DVH05_003962 [Phytophthora capsici]
MLQENLHFGSQIVRAGAKRVHDVSNGGKDALLESIGEASVKPNTGKRSNGRE